MSLHDQLQQLADTAPRPAIDHAVWDRGRALRRRDRVVSSAVVLAMVVTLGGFVAVVTGPPTAFAPAGDTVPEGAIPSRIYDVPADADLPLETDLAIGRASVAFVADGRPVVISASDGRYHVLDLPDWGDGSVLAISPSGDRLAWLSSGTGGPPALSRLTLDTGEIDTTRIPQGAGLEPASVAWSADGTRLAWLGGAPFGSASGVIDAEDGPRESVATPSRRGLVGIAVTNDGALALGTESGGLLLDAHRRAPRRVARSDGFPANFSPDGAVLALETRIPVPLSPSIQVDTGQFLRHAFPADTIGSAAVRPMGWPGDRLQLLLVQESSDDDAEFVVTTPTVSQTSTWRRSVGSVDPGAATTLTVAVDLLPDLDGTSSQQLTHDFGEPDWARERDISWMIGLGVAAALSVLYGLRWVWRRRTLLF